MNNIFVKVYLIAVAGAPVLMFYNTDLSPAAWDMGSFGPNNNNGDYYEFYTSYFSTREDAEREILEGDLPLNWPGSSFEIREFTVPSSWI